MQRVTVTLDEELMAELDRIMAERGYANRSEAIRDLTRAGLARARIDATPDAPCVAAMVYTYDHHAREVSRKLTAAHHDHHDLTVSSLHVHLDHEQCLEVSILKGSVGEVRHFAESSRRAEECSERRGGHNSVEQRARIFSETPRIKTREFQARLQNCVRISPRGPKRAFGESARPASSIRGRRKLGFPRGDPHRFRLSLVMTSICVKA